MTDLPISTSAKEQLHHITTTLVNAWLLFQKKPSSNDVNQYKEDINRFLNLSLRTVLELTAKDILQELPAEHKAFITKETLLPFFMPPEQVTPPVPKYAPPVRPPVIDETNGKTFIEGWRYTQSGMTKFKKRVHEVLNMVQRKKIYLEDVTREDIYQYSKSKYVWEEFVKMRGY